MYNSTNANKPEETQTVIFNVDCYPQILNSSVFPYENTEQFKLLCVNFTTMLQSVSKKHSEDEDPLYGRENLVDLYHDMRDPGPGG